MKNFIQDWVFPIALAIAALCVICWVANRVKDANSVYYTVTMLTADGGIARQWKHVTPQPHMWSGGTWFIYYDEKVQISGVIVIEQER